MKFSGANNSCLVIRNKEIIELKADKQPIGFYSHAFPFTQQEFQLQANDCVYQYTDGYVDQFGGEKGKKFKTANFKRLIISIQHETIDKQLELIDKNVHTSTFDTKGNFREISTAFAKALGFLKEEIIGLK